MESSGRILLWDRIHQRERPRSHGVKCFLFCLIRPWLWPSTPRSRWNIAINGAAKPVANMYVLRGCGEFRLTLIFGPGCSS